MRYKQMLADNWLLFIGIPIILVLLVMAWRRTRAIQARFAEVREEMERNPQHPYAALGEIMQERKKQERTRGKRTH